MHGSPDFVVALHFTTNLLSLPAQPFQGASRIGFNCGAQSCSDHVARARETTADPATKSTYARDELIICRVEFRCGRLARFAPLRARGVLPQIVQCDPT